MSTRGDRDGGRVGDPVGASASGTVFEFGTFSFATETGELARAGRRRRLEPQPARVLRLLLERAGELVTRDELRDLVWGQETHVDFERGIAYCIRQVRAALDDTGDNPRFVETLPRRGYRFIAPLTRADQAQGSAQPGAAGPSPAAKSAARGGRTWLRYGLAVVAVLAIGGALGVAISRTSGWRSESPLPVVAVARFDNETEASEHDARVNAATDAVVDRLTALGRDHLGVIGNAATLRSPREERDPAAIQRETGADHLVLGQLQPDDAGLRLVLHLIRLDDGTHLWATRIVRPAEDLAGLESEAADQVTAAVRSHLLELAAVPRTSP
jgi:DNA-binding winged helix-turn-helix (wHTH) protein/TolB-like protein